MPELKNFDQFRGVFDGFVEEVERSFLRKVRGPNDAPLDPRNSRVRYSDSLRLNASVRLDADGLPSYVFNFGMCLALIDACMTVSANERFCGGIPFATSRVLVVHQTNPPERFVDYHYLVKDGKLAWPYTQVLDDPQLDEAPRGRLGNHLFEMMCKFISTHEQAHFLLGHAHYLNSFRSGLNLEEVPPKKASVIPPEDLRVFELSADSLACTLLLDNFLRPGIKPMTPRGLWIQDASQPEQWLFYAFLGIAMLFGLLDRADRLVSRSEAKRSHPSAAVRLLYALRMLQNSIDQHIPDDTQRKNMVKSLFQEREAAFEILGCAPLSMEAFSEYFDSDVQNYTTAQALAAAAIEKRASDLLPSLAPYAQTARSSLGMNF